MDEHPEFTGRKQDGTFVPGVSGNPAGRPKGARSKLTDDFFKAMAKAFEDQGEAAIAEMIREKPADFVKTIAGLQTKEVSGQDGAKLFDGVAITITD